MSKAANSSCLIFRFSIMASTTRSASDTDALTSTVVVMRDNVSEIYCWPACEWVNWVSDPCGSINCTLNNWGSASRNASQEFLAHQAGMKWDWLDHRLAAGRYFHCPHTQGYEWWLFVTMGSYLPTSGQVRINSGQVGLSHSLPCIMSHLGVVLELFLHNPSQARFHPWYCLIQQFIGLIH